MCFVSDVATHYHSLGGVEPELHYILVNSFQVPPKLPELSTSVLSISVFKIKIQSVVLQFGLNPNSSSGRYHPH